MKRQTSNPTRLPATIRPPVQADEGRWRELWNGYNRFYERIVDESVTATTWRRLLDPLEGVHALLFYTGEEVHGFVHFLFHRSTSAVEDVCYLQDLFVDPAARREGTGRQLTEAVTGMAQERRAPMVYWLTHETNRSAKGLYDQIAKRSGFEHYLFRIPVPPSD